MNATLLRRTLAATSLLLAVVLVAGCNDDTSGDSGSSSGNPTSKPVPSGEGNPFSSSFTAPDHGEPGQTITATLTNTGRLPDAYQVLIEPGAAATVVANADTHLSPGESAEIKIKINSTPFDIHLKNVGGGVPENVVGTVR